MLVGMDWVTIGLILLAVTTYAAVVFYVRHRIAAEEAAGAAPAAGPDGAVPEGGENPPSESKGWFSEHVMFYGPILALRTTQVGIFDRFRLLSLPLKAYASVGVVLVVVIMAAMVLILLLSLQMMFAIRPEPTGIYAARNILLIPGVNQFVPMTIPVWLAFASTLAIHEFGHGILSRVEGIKVKAAGLLVAVVPIGAFVEPDEEELEKAPRAAKMRMYGAGITNNIVFGFLAFFLMIAVFGLAVPPTAPVIYGVLTDSPAYNASVAPGSVLLALNGTPVDNIEDVARLLAPSRPGDPTSLTVEQDGVVTTRELTLDEWPSGNISSGFMGVEYLDGKAIQRYVKGSFNPGGILAYMILPFYPSATGLDLRLLAFPGADIGLWTEPFWGFWILVQFLFWLGFISLAVGTFNALPIVPFDGGFIFREVVSGALSRFRLERYAPAVVSAVSFVLAFTLISLVALPFLFSLF